MAIDSGRLEELREAQRGREIERVKSRVEQRIWTEYHNQLSSSAAPGTNPSLVDPEEGDEEAARDEEAGESGVAAENAAADTLSGEAAQPSEPAASSFDEFGIEYGDWDFQFEEDIDHRHVRSAGALKIEDEARHGALAESVRESLLESGLYSASDLKSVEEAAETEQERGVGAAEEGTEQAISRNSSALWYSYRLLPQEAAEDGEQVEENEDQLTFSIQEARFRSRRVALHVRVHQLGLPESVLERLLEIVGPRFSSEKAVLKLVSDSAPRREENFRRVQIMFKALMSSAYEADSNYVIPRGEQEAVRETAETQLTSLGLSVEEREILFAKQLQDEADVRNAIYQLLIKQGVSETEAEERAAGMDLGPGYSLIDERIQWFANDILAEPAYALSDFSKATMESTEEAQGEDDDGEHSGGIVAGADEEEGKAAPATPFTLIKILPPSM